MTAAELLRADLRLLADLVPDGARVVDVGCGDGALIEFLRDRKGCSVRGIELSVDQVVTCVGKGLPVIQANLEEGLSDFPDGSADVVVISQTLQEVRNIRRLVRDAMRVGERAIISYPNFGQASSRLRLAFRGRMPVSDVLPYQWYDTPNVHFTTVRDFRKLCEEADLAIDREVWLRIGGGSARRITWLPNLRAELAIAVVSKR